MLINIPFIYEAVIKDVTGVTATVAVLDHINVGIKEHKISNLTLALKDGPFRSFGVGDDLFEEMGNIITEAPYYTPLTKSAAIGSMSYFISPFNDASSSETIANYFVRDIPNMDTEERILAAKAALERGGHLRKKENITYREWSIDSREETITSIKTKAEELVFIDNFTYKKRSEPIYVVSIIDVRKYKGNVRVQNSTGQCIMMFKASADMVEKLKNGPSNAICTYVFNANQYADACKMANDLAKEINLPLDEPIALSHESQQVIVYESSTIKYPPNRGEAL